MQQETLIQPIIGFKERFYDEVNFKKAIRKLLDNAETSGLDSLFIEAHLNLDDDEFFRFEMMVDEEASWIEKENGVAYHLDVFAGILDHNAAQMGALKLPNSDVPNAILGKEWVNVSSIRRLRSADIRKVLINVLDGKPSGLPLWTPQDAEPCAGYLLVRSVEPSQRLVEKQNYSADEKADMFNNKEWNLFRESYLSQPGALDQIVELTPPIEISYAKSGALEEIVFEEAFTVMEQINNIQKIVQDHPNTQIKLDPVTNGAGEKHTRVNIYNYNQYLFMGDAYIPLLPCQTQKIFENIVTRKQQVKAMFDMDQQSNLSPEQGNSSLGFGATPGVLH